MMDIVNGEADTLDTDLDTDLVTQLQADLALVCEHLFVGIGSLQRDARPVPLEDEEVVGGGGTTLAGGADDVGDIQAMATRMGGDLAESLRQLERHIHLLPEVVYDTSKHRGGEGVEAEEVRALLAENRALREKLEGVVRVRTEEVNELEEKYRRVVDDLLRSRDGALGANTDDAGGEGSGLLL